MDKKSKSSSKKVKELKQILAEIRNDPEAMKQAKLLSSSGNSDICICSHSKKEHKYNDIEGCSKCPCEYYKTKRLEVTHTGEKTENPDTKRSKYE